VRSLDDALRKSGQPIELHLYAGAGHAFEDAGHPNHHAAAARQVFERSVAFFHRYL
jgi:carboxymethylenebutenolidase